jgi:hypothetical protein
LGVAILGSILAVAFRAHLGTGTPGQVAARLDQPIAAVSTVPASARVSTYASGDASQSIGNALDFAQHAENALQARAKLPGQPALTPDQLAAAKAKDGAVLEQFVGSSKSSFMSGMHITSLFAGLVALLGAIVAFLFLPSKREFGELSARRGVVVPDAAMAH